MMHYKTHRRDFLKTAGMVCAGLSSASSSVFNLRSLGNLVGHQLSSTSDYKAMVCLFLGGGADSYNMLIPRSQDEYNVYKTTRANLAINQSDLLPLNFDNITGAQYGLHPMMNNISQMVNSGEAAWISNIGTLVNPVTKNEYFNGLTPLPLGLYSHSDQSNQWMTASPAEKRIKGWAGRIADLMYDSNTEKQISMNVSFAGTNYFQRGEKNIEFSVSNNGAVTLDGYGGMYNLDPLITSSVDKMLSHEYNDPYKNTYTNLMRKSLDSSVRFNEILDKVPDLVTPFPDDYFINQFKMIARIIAARDQLGFKRQIFFIDFGGWDNHDDLLADQNYLLMKLDMALGLFNQALKEINMFDQVVTFTMSEFARTLTSNGNGTDHAWGGNSFAFGGPVRGNKLYGNYPTLAIDSDLDVGSGSIIPTLSNDMYFAELALWFGVPPSELHTILPNLHNFYAQGNNQNPIGFLNI